MSNRWCVGVCVAALVLAGAGMASAQTKLLRFPDSSHELSRSGKPRYRRERFEAILDWHRRHLDVTT